MAGRREPQQQVAPCRHSLLSCDVSEHASTAGYTRPDSRKRLSAAVTQSKLGVSSDVPPTTFPPPLLLPGDDLGLDPKYPAQSLRSWLRLKHRNEVSEERKTIYVAPPPKISSTASFMKSWSIPASYPKSPAPADFVEVALYLRAFYHGLEVKMLPLNLLNFTNWDDKNSALSRKKSRVEAEPEFVGLNIGSECIGIRTRPSADKTFPRQLNLDDILDATISVLPTDAYALLLLVEQDLYEDEDDIFVCGRAYGGSRVAVVSTARYNPILDETAGIDADHSWPASHCEIYINRCLQADSTSKIGNDHHVPKKGKSCATHTAQSSGSSKSPAIVLDDEDPSPIEAAVIAHSLLPPSTTREGLQGLWLGRVCRTSSHELGHCFGIDHCVYYACVMQGSASVQEDARQPPYVCPVDLAKIYRATGASESDRNEALLKYCLRHPNIHMFASLAAWLQRVSST